MVQFSGPKFLHIQSYMQWKIGFMTSPKLVSNRCDKKTSIFSACEIQIERDLLHHKEDIP